MSDAQQDWQDRASATFERAFPERPQFGPGDKLRCKRDGLTITVSSVEGASIYYVWDDDPSCVVCRPLYQFVGWFEPIPIPPLPQSKREAREMIEQSRARDTEPALAPAAEGYHDRKFDQGKSRPDLIPAAALEGLGDVLAYGAAKYAEDSWQQVPDAVKRYHAALLRHMTEIKKHGLQSRDEESGKLHIDHALTNAAFLSHFARQ